MSEVTVIQVKVKPNARQSVLSRMDDGTWLAQLKAQPVDGKANEELVGLVARHYGCSRSAVSIKGGASGRNKWVRIESVGRAAEQSR
jgi:uncharacterized protein (TIGR00251 family)